MQAFAPGDTPGPSSLATRKWFISIDTPGPSSLSPPEACLVCSARPASEERLFPAVSETECLPSTPVRCSLALAWSASEDRRFAVAAERAGASLVSLCPLPSGLLRLFWMNFTAPATRPATPNTDATTVAISEALLSPPVAPPLVVLVAFEARLLVRAEEIGSRARLLEAVGERTFASAGSLWWQ